VALGLHNLDEVLKRVKILIVNAKVVKVTNLLNDFTEALIPGTVTTINERFFHLLAERDLQRFDIEVLPELVATSQEI
jgi:hypothetical protein